MDAPTETGPDRLLELCEEYLHAVANAKNMIQLCGDALSCYAFEVQRQDIHLEMSAILDVDYETIGKVLCNLEQEIGFPKVPIDMDEFSSFKQSLGQYALKLKTRLMEVSLQ